MKGRDRQHLILTDVLMSREDLPLEEWIDLDDEDFQARLRAVYEAIEAQLSSKTILVSRICPPAAKCDAGSSDDERPSAHVAPAWTPAVPMLINAAATVSAIAKIAIFTTPTMFTFLDSIVTIPTMKLLPDFRG